MSDDLKKVLIVDDDVAVTNYFMVFLMQTELFEPKVENDSRRVMDLLQENSYDVVMLDLDMPNVTGMEILQKMDDARVQVPVIILTGASDVDLAVRAMKMGAFNYLTKPVDDEHLLEVLAGAVEMGTISQTMDGLPEDVQHEDLDHQAAFEHLPTKNPTMVRLFHQAETMAKGNLCVFIWGERGAGKKCLAQAIHQASPRKDGPFVALDCLQYAPDDFSGILFGRAKTYSGASEGLSGGLCEAAGGTLFLNNIEHLTPQVQMRLNHALHTGEFYRNNNTEILQCDVRFIVASTQDLTGTEFQDSFSRDLLYHVMVNHLQIPPLRERPEDIPMLVEYFLKEETQRADKDITSVHPELMDQLNHYLYPGNLLELRKLLGSAVANCQTDQLKIEDLSDDDREQITQGAFPGTFEPRPLADVVSEQVKGTLRYCDGDKNEAARLLKISPEELDNYLSR